MYKRCTDCEKRGKISEKKKNKQKPNSLIFIQVNSNSFIVIHHIKDFGYIIVKDDCRMFKCYVHNQWGYDHRHISGGGLIKL